MIIFFRSVQADLLLNIRENLFSGKLRTSASYFWLWIDLLISFVVGSEKVADGSWKQKY